MESWLCTKENWRRASKHARAKFSLNGPLDTPTDTYHYVYVYTREGMHKYKAYQLAGWLYMCTDHQLLSGWIPGLVLLSIAAGTVEGPVERMGAGLSSAGLLSEEKCVKYIHLHRHTRTHILHVHTLISRASYSLSFSPLISFPLGLHRKERGEAWWKGTSSLERLPLIRHFSIHDSEKVKFLQCPQQLSFTQFLLTEHHSHCDE